MAQPLDPHQHYSVGADADPTQTARMHELLDKAAFYPAIIKADLNRYVAGEQIDGQLVLDNFDISDDGLDRDMRVAVLTPSRIIVWAGHETDANELAKPPKKLTLHSHVQVISLSKVNDLRLATAVENPHEYVEGDLPSSLSLNIIFSAIDRFLTQPVAYRGQEEDEDEDRSVGMYGDVEHDCYVFEVRAAAHGEGIIQDALQFAQQLAVNLGMY